jgi:choline transport protein
MKNANTAFSMVKRNSDGETLSPDELLLRAQGHQGELPRQFSSFSALSLAFVITNSWVGYCSTFVTALLAGGGPAVFWGIVVAATACLIISTPRHPIKTG